jgi:hypothetical protein
MAKGLLHGNESPELVFALTQSGLLASRNYTHGMAKAHLVALSALSGHLNITRPAVLGGMSLGLHSTCAYVVGTASLRCPGPQKSHLHSRVSHSLTGTTKMVASQRQPHNEAGPSTQQVRTEDSMTGARPPNGAPMSVGASFTQTCKSLGLEHSKGPSSHDCSSSYQDGRAGSHLWVGET